MQVQIKFTASGANSAIGGFAPNDKARVDATLAAHFVDVAKVAVYVDVPIIEATEKPAEKPAKKTLHRRG